jgi:hypothetical protein
MGNRQLRFGNRTDAANLDAGHHAGTALLPVLDKAGLLNRRADERREQRVGIERL